MPELVVFFVDNINNSACGSNIKEIVCDYRNRLHFCELIQHIYNLFFYTQSFFFRHTLNHSPAVCEHRVPAIHVRMFPPALFCVGFFRRFLHKIPAFFAKYSKRTKRRFEMSDKLITPTRPVYIVAAGSCVGREEKAGPLGECFDMTDEQGFDRFGASSYERAEAQMQRIALDVALGKAQIGALDVDAIFSGDLQNQCAASAYATAEVEAPHFGLFGACSTSAEALILASMYAAALGGTAVALTSSHNCTAERQFRFPLDYGAQRPPSAQWTVTGAGAFVVSSDRKLTKRGAARAFSDGAAVASGTDGASDVTATNLGGGASPDRAIFAEMAPPYPEGAPDGRLFPEIPSDVELASEIALAEPRAPFAEPQIDDPPAARYQAAKPTRDVEIVAMLPGISRDNGVNDAADMGAAMAPAACDTLARFFKLSGTSPAEFDLILTGDLGVRGKGLLCDLLDAQGIDASGVLDDCGAMIYDAARQDKHAGGSGCGCSATVLASYVLPKLRSGELSDVLFVATGALMNPQALMQGENIVGVAHLVRLRSGRRGK